MLVESDDEESQSEDEEVKIMFRSDRLCLGLKNVA